VKALRADRMTQAVLTGDAEPDLFAQHQPKPLLSVMLIEQGRDIWLRRIRSWVWRCRMMKSII
jgi:phosphoribosylformylglycinamidine synthase